MIFTADQIVAHLVGDYITQSHWMATEKTKRSVAASIHAFIYTVPFALITTSIAALAVICLSHFAIDRWRLARYLVWWKNFIGDRASWPNAERRLVPPGRTELQYSSFWRPTDTGYPEAVPAWLSVWLLIIADNTLHIVINGIAIWWFA